MQKIIALNNLEFDVLLKYIIILLGKFEIRGEKKWLNKLVSMWLFLMLVIWF